MVVTARQRIRFLRQAIAELYAAAGGTDPAGTDMARFVADTRARAEAANAVRMNTEGRLRNGNGGQ